MPPKRLRGYISVARVSELMNAEGEWPVHRVRRWLKREQAVTLKGRYWYTTRSKLRMAFADIYQELFLHEF